MYVLLVSMHGETSTSEDDCHEQIIYYSQFPRGRAAHHAVRGHMALGLIRPEAERENVGKNLYCGFHGRHR